jgi:starch synthase (maltosyl-transferring)
MNSLHRLPRIVIEQVTPQLDGGRYPVKRSSGGVVDVGAAIFKDGHDQILADIVVTGPDSQEPQRIPLTYRFEPDRWYGSFRVHNVGRYKYWIEAWPDHFGSWRSDLEKRVAAGQDVRPELLEGARILEQRARFLHGEAQERVIEGALLLANAERGLEQRLERAFSQDLLEWVKGPGDPDEVARLDRALELLVDVPEASFSAWYELFPRSQTNDPMRHGTFAETQRRLPELAALGFDVLYLPPIHPIGETHRKGRNNSKKAEPGDVGSPWAIGSKLGGHTAVHPELGTLEDFRELVKAGREFGIEIALDYALQCSPDHPWVREHPDWFFIRPDGSIRYAENPPKKYEDIYPINFWCKDQEGLWNACRDVLLFWIEQGVKVFRVDNPHTKPFAFWEWVLREVNERHPDVIYLSESFTRPNRMKALAKLGFNQSYTYFTWKNSAWELKDYLTELTSAEMTQYFRPNFFCNTPDILHEYLQAGGRPAFRIRLVLAATLAPVYGIYSGYELCENQPVRRGSEEYLDSEKYQIRVRDWNAPHSIKPDIARLNRIRRENPALQELGNLSFFHSEYEGILAYRKHAPSNDLLVIVNLDPHHAHDSIVHVPIAEMGIGESETYEVTDLLTASTYLWRGSRNYVRLDPAERVAHVLRVSRRG